MDSPSTNRRILARVLPFLAWFERYDLKSLRSDLLAGITVSAVLLPQSMAYAMLAGLPPVYGLYAAAITPAVGALWGSLRQLATGPIAVTSLLVLTTLSARATAGSEAYVDLAGLLALQVGLIYLLVGVLRLGQIMTFVSHAAVRGFTAAAALIIIATQLPALLGIEVGRHENLVGALTAIVRALPQTNWQSAVIGAAAFAAIYGLKRLKRELPAGLLVLSAAAVVVYLLGLAEHGVAVIGTIPAGLPRPHLPAFELEVASDLLGPAVVIALVSFTETYAVSKSIAAETRQKVDVNQEFVGQGLANLIGGFFQSYPVAGSLSRSAINYSAGAVSGLASAFTSAIVVLALLFLTPLVAFLPRPALAALVIGAVLLLFHPGQVFALWRMNRHDGIVAIAVFVLALVLKPDYALLIGVLASLVLFLWKTMHPRIVRVVRDPARDSFVNADAAGRPGCPQLLHLRCDNAIYFGNAEYTIEQILERVELVETPLRFVMLDFAAVGFVDVTGIDELRALRTELAKREARLALVDVHLPVRQVFERAGFMEGLTTDCSDAEADCLLRGKGEAIGLLFARLDHDYCRGTCPHAVFQECSKVK